MRTQVSRMKIVRQAKGVPALAASSNAVVLECGIHRSTRGDWRWLTDYTQERGKRWSRRVTLRQQALRRYCGKPLISACLRVDRSVFLIFVDPKTKAAVFWEERRRQPSGRVVIRYR